MNIKNRTFYLIIGIGTLICIIIGIIVRFSITEFKFDSINNKCNSFAYCPYDDIEYSNGTYINVDEAKNTDSIYKYIVKGRCVGNRKVLEDAVLTEVQVDKVLKGDISGGRIKIYEPVGLQGNTVSTFEGYNFIKDNKDYIFCLTDLKEGVKNYDENNIKIYNYSTPFYGKFPIEYKDSDFIVYIKGDREKPKEYNEFQNSEQVFSSNDKRNLYFDEYNRLMNLLK
ncbi:hypothetical protein KQI89_07660 [Clostridium sp. MSJ-4]|uniref:Lipoprotein n=1 Tax=Clostridium simiarum TaxID=2841506 RepID=A0ABS6F180_9CLOT|nr:hypothetical protein [Clostridium simiarum]MBU5591639.1 hypothetical protein [Clostridium simiarum]